MPMDLEEDIPKHHLVRVVNAAFVDGTKIEANANRYTFVWGKTVSKHKAKLQEKVGRLAFARP